MITEFCPCAANEDKRVAAKFVYRRKELLYDVKNYAFVEGDIMPEEEYSRHQVIDIGEEGNVDRVTRILNLTHAEVVEFLYPYTKEPVLKEDEESVEMDDRLTEPEEYTIDLSLPEGFSRTTVQLLNRLIHEYFVCRVLEDWLSITAPNSAAKWKMKLEETKEMIRTSLMIRRKMVRRPLKPF